MTDAFIERDLRRLRGTERQTIARIVERLMQVDDRRIYLKRACSNLTRYCIERLGYSERAAGRRVGAARLAKLYPCIPDMLRRGDIDLSNLEIIAPVLRHAVDMSRLLQAVGKTRSQLEQLVAEWSPKPDLPLRMWEVTVDTRQMRLDERVQARVEACEQARVPTVVAEHPTLAEQSTVAAQPTLQLPPERPAPRPKPLSPGRFGIQFTIDADAHAYLEALIGHLRHSIPDGDPAKIIAKALKALRKSVEARKFGKLSAKRAAKKPSNEQELPLAPLPPAEVAATAHPEAEGPELEASATGRLPRDDSTREVQASATDRVALDHATREVQAPASGRVAPDRVTRREVAERDNYRCCFTSDDGHRCTSTAWLENDHRIRVADGGPTDVANLRLLCRAHNAGREKGIHPR